jgi:hypothetical protein
MAHRGLVRYDFAAPPTHIGRPLGGHPAALIESDRIVGHGYLPCSVSGAHSPDTAGRIAADLRFSFAI